MLLSACPLLIVGTLSPTLHHSLPSGPILRSLPEWCRFCSWLPWYKIFSVAGLMVPPAAVNRDSRAYGWTVPELLVIATV